MICALVLALVLPAAIPDATLQKIAFEQKLGASVSLDLPFRDEQDKPVHLGDYFHKRPVILVLGYYKCPMLCTMVLNGMAGALQDIQPRMGRDYDVVNVSIDPNETPALAAAKKKSYVTRFGQPGAAGGWHFLTGDDAPIHRLADEAGFEYAYDPVSKQYAHPSGIIILAPDGKISQYLTGVDFSSAQLAKALADAGQSKVGSRLAQIFLLCFHYSPVTGKYSNLVLTVVRVMSIGIIAGLLALIAVARRRKPAQG